MSMEKYGVSNEMLLHGLQSEEARIMRMIQKTLDPGCKTAADRPSLERELANVRAQIEELRKEE